MILDEEEDKLEAFLEHGFEPKPWMRATDRVIDAYKSEVEKLRIEVRLLSAQYAALSEDIEILKNLHTQLTGLLEGDK